MSDKLRIFDVNNSVFSQYCTTVLMMMAKEIVAACLPNLESQVRLLSIRRVRPGSSLSRRAGYTRPLLLMPDQDEKMADPSIGILIARQEPQTSSASAASGSGQDRYCSTSSNL